MLMLMMMLVLVSQFVGVAETSRESVDEEHEEECNENPIPCAEAMSAVGCFYESTCDGEPLLREEVVDAETEGDGTNHDGEDVEAKCAATECLADNEDAGTVDGRT